MREAGSGTRKAIERLFHDHGLDIRPRLELGSNEAIKQAILAGLGISALSCHALALHQPGQFAVLDSEGFPIQRHWYAVYPAGRQISVVARAFLDYLLDQRGGSVCSPEGGQVCCGAECERQGGAALVTPVAPRPAQPARKG
jgi:DNA-binding transcriptional LysR family regulator